MSTEMLRSIHNSQDNIKCFECSDKKSSWACTELCIFLCIDCAHKLKSECPEVFMIKSISMAAWSDQEIEKLSNGGNLRLRSLLGQYQIDNLSSLQYKYCCRAVDYYRQVLKSELFNYASPKPPSLEEGPIYLYTERLTWWEKTKKTIKELAHLKDTKPNPSSPLPPAAPSYMAAFCGLRELSCTYASETLSSISESFQPNYVKMEESLTSDNNR